MSSSPASETIRLLNDVARETKKAERGDLASNPDPRELRSSEAQSQLRRAAPRSWGHRAISAFLRPHPSPRSGRWLDDQVATRELPVSKVAHVNLKEADLDKLRAQGDAVPR